MAILFLISHVRKRGKVAKQGWEVPGRLRGGYQEGKIAKTEGQNCYLGVLEGKMAKIDRGNC